MEALNNILGEYESIATAFYTFVGFLAAISAIAYRANVWKNASQEARLQAEREQKARWKEEIMEAVELALTKQRQENQAEFFDKNVNRMDDLDRYFLEQGRDINKILRWISENK